MKKPLTSPEAFTRQLAEIAAEFIASLPSEIHRDALLDFFSRDPERWHECFFAVSDPEPAPARGRGERAEIHVSWIWPAEVQVARSIADLIRARIAALSGVEGVSEPDVDTQLGACWSVCVTIRLTQ